MRQYSYFPGCSSEASASPLGISVLPVAKELGIDLVELEDWNCCGSTPYGSVNKLEATCLAARNLAMAEKKGLDLVTPCSNCYVTLNMADAGIREYPGVKARVNEALAAANLEYAGGVRVRHLAEVLYQDITPEVIGAKVVKSLKGLKVAPYYGCQLVRPDGFDDPESPRSLDELVGSLGAEVVPWELKAQCCGSSLVMAEQEMALGLISKILRNAQENGAQCLVTPCPLCQINLDAYQSQVNRSFKTRYHLPVLFITQLLGVALGIKPRALALSRNIVSPMGVLAAYL